mgnify:FL=1|jgi:hypothetical protein|tara:strand:+ start:124 stop:333 length:210 start_codon:yes stop_codon:yes gene_type:complete
MKLALNIFLFLIALLTYSEYSLSLTDYKIKIICKKEKKEAICIKNLLEKRSNLQKGNKIEIPVKPYKGN